MPRQVSPKGAKLQADQAWSELIRSRGYCQAQNWVDPDTGHVVDCKGELQAAHIVRRGYWATRHDPTNGLCLCASHHLFFDQHDPHAFTRFLDEHLGADHVAELRRTARDGVGNNPKGNQARSYYLAVRDELRGTL